MLPAVPGLRRNTILFVTLLPVPAAVLAWLGFAATGPLEEGLRGHARSEVLRAVGDAAAVVGQDVLTALAGQERELAVVASHLVETLPVQGIGALAAADAVGPGALLLLDARGWVRWPAPPSDLAMAYLDEWPAYRRFEQQLARGAVTEPLRAEAATFTAPSLRARALVQSLADAGPAVRDLLPELSVAELAAAGPMVMAHAVAVAGPRERPRLAAALWATPAIAAQRARWWEQLDDAPAAARERLRARFEAGAPVGLVAVPLPAGARLVRLLEPAQLLAGLERRGGPCALTFRSAATPFPVRFPSPAHASIAVPTACGPVEVAAEHQDLLEQLEAARWRRGLTGVGVAALVAVMGLGLCLVRRALWHEAAARRLRDQFLANVSHDLKTPLTGLRLHAELLGAPDLDAATRQRYGAVVRAEGARLSALVEDLLELSALQQGRRQVEVEPVDLGATLRAEAEAWRPLFERDGTALHIAVHGDVEALADPVALGRIVTNLLQNAMRHGRPSRDGGPSWVRLEAGPGPRVVVRDNGPGVPAALRERLFARTLRRAPVGEGLGLGLAVSRELARACGGDLHCRDDGSTLFELTLPSWTPEESS